MEFPRIDRETEMRVIKVMAVDSQLLKSARFVSNSLEHPNAWVGHLPFAAWVIQQVRPEIFVELGTHSGNSYFAFCQSVLHNQLATRCFAVDTWEGDEHSLKYSNEVYDRVVAENSQYAAFSTLLRMTFDEALGSFADQSVDLLHIDGLHTFEAVSHDFETWFPKLKPGALVLFHDTNVRENNFGVWKLWARVQKQFPNHLEFLHSHGLGVVQIDGPAKGEMPWLRPDFADRADLIAYFEALGAAQLERFAAKWARIEIDAQHQAIMERDDVARRLGEELSAAYAKLDSVHAEMNAYIERLKDRVGTLEQRGSDLEAELATAYAKMGQIHTDMNAYIDRLKDRVANLEQHESELQTELAGMRQSPSWKVTAPLRWANRQGKART